MTETSAVAIVIAGISSTLLAVFGVDYYALLWATIGSVTTLLYAAPTKKTKGAVTTIISAFVGAALGSLANEHWLTSRSFLLVTALVGGAGAQPLVSALVNRAIKMVNTGAGNPLEPKE